MGWLIALAVLVLLAWLPLGISARYDSRGPLLRLIAGPVRIKLYPGKLKTKEKQQKPKPAKQKKPAQQEPKKPASGGSLGDFLPFARIVWEFLTEFRHRLRVKVLQLDLILGGGDPCDLAQNYGKACAAMGNLWPRLEEFLVIKKRDVKIQCDFTASETLVTARLDLTLTLGRLLVMGGGYGFRLLREFLNFKNKRKGGASL